MQAKTYLGAALLNGPGGAADTPERFYPREYSEGVPTEFALVISAASLDEAREKQIVWHALMRRANDLRFERQPVAAYESQRREAICLLESIAKDLLD